MSFLALDCICGPTCPPIGSSQIGPPGPSGATGTGTQGPTGASAFTTTTSSFTVPAEGTTAPVPVLNASWMTVGQEVYLQGAGYYIVQAGTAGTTAYLEQDPAAPANAAPLTVIASGAQISPAGFAGVAGSSYNPSSPLGINSGGTGQTTAYQAFNALSPLNLSGQLIVFSAGNNVLLPAAGSDGYLLTSKAASLGGVVWESPATLGLLGGGGGGVSGSYWDPQADGFFKEDDEFASLGAYTSYTVGGTLINTSIYGQDAVNKVVGSAEFATGGTNAAGQGSAFNYGPAAVGGGMIYLGIAGQLIFKTSVFFEGSLPPTGISYYFRAGLGSYGSASEWFGTSGPNDFIGLAFQYVPDNNSGEWQIVVGANYTNPPTIYNTTVPVAANTRWDLEIQFDTAFADTALFYINGVQVLSVASPTGSVSPFWLITRGTSSTTSYTALTDFWMGKYAFTR
jgi:hypothetical protein